MTDVHAPRPAYDAGDYLEHEDEQAALNAISGERPWHRRPGEPNFWYDRFMRFCRIGSRRTLLILYNEERVAAGSPKRRNPSGGMVNAAKKWSWAERAEAYDADRRARDEAVSEKRRRQLLEQEWTSSRDLLDKVNQMLKFPLAKTTREDVSEDGKTIVQTTVMPIRWSMVDVARLLEVADRLGRGSVGLEQGRTVTELSGPGGEPIPIDRETVHIYIPDNGRGDTIGREVLPPQANQNNSPPPKSAPEKPENDG